LVYQVGGFAVIKYSDGKGQLGVRTSEWTMFCMVELRGGQR